LALNLEAGDMSRVISLLAASGLIVSGSLAGPAAANAATTGAGAAAATITSLRSSTTSSRYDSWVTFRAQVSAKSGRVAFTDTSNGTVLGTAAVRDGTATFSTAALAPGTRTVAARYLGSAHSGRSSPAATRIRVAATAAATEAVAYQVDDRHDGNQGGPALRAGSLARKWSVTLGGKGGGDVEAGDVSYPVIAGGRVFVTVENSVGYGSKLYALNAATGKTEWSTALGGAYGFSALAYDGQRLFSLNEDGVLTAFTAATGHENWATVLPGDSYGAAPTAYDGAVYVSGSADIGGAVYGISEANGTITWAHTVSDGDNSSPAVGSSGVYVSYDCQQDYRFSLSGALIWHRNPDCYGGGGSTAVMHGSSIYARGSDDSPLILSKSSGQVTGSFASDTAPAVSSSTMYTLQKGKLVAVSASGSPDRWSFGGGNLVTPPIVDGGVVYEGSRSGRVYGVSATSGHQVWSAKAGSVIVASDEQNADVRIGMAVGGGLLVVPAGPALTAFAG
jgi:outer membrane protein assembly factor BamB